MISHPLDQSNPSCVINFATIFVNQHHKTGIVLLQLGRLLLSVAFTKRKSILCSLLKNMHVYKNADKFLHKSNAAYDY